MIAFVLVALLLILAVWILFSAFGFIVHLLAIGFVIGAGIWLFSLLRRHLLER